MRSFLPILATVSAFNCSEFGIESFDKLNVVSEVLDTPPRSTNKTFYFNPCAPIQGPEECGNDNYLCEIDAIEINGGWETTAIKQFGSAAQGMTEEVVIPIDDGLVFIYYGAAWGDMELHGQVLFECSNVTNIALRRQESFPLEYGGLIISTPRVCGVKYDEPEWLGNKEWNIWEVIGRASVTVFFLLAVYVAIALFVFSRSRPLGPISEEVRGALNELPALVRGIFIDVYERITGRGTGRNTI